MIEHQTCIICNSKELVDLKGYEKAYICQCQSCRMVFSRKIPSKEKLFEFYNNYGVDSYLSPLTIKRYNELLDQFEGFRKTNRILDVGCGKGYFLEVAKKRGWEVYGTEISNNMVNICLAKNIKVHQGDLEQSSFPNDYFDIISSFEVIEHINNPQNEIFIFNKILRIGGLVYLTTPNFNSLLRYRLKSTYNVITFPEHLCYYTPSTINTIFTKFGFKKQKIETTGLSLTRFKTSRGRSNQKFVSEKSDDEKIRIHIDNKWYLKFSKKIINALLSTFGVGDSLKAWFIKN